MFFLSVLLGLGVTLGWGVGDFSGKKLVNAYGAYGPILALQLCFAVGVPLVSILSGVPLAISLPTLGLLALGSLGINGSWFLFFRALTVGNVSAICAIYSLWAIIPLVYQTLSGELVPSFVQWTGMVIMLAAGVLVSLDLSSSKHGLKKALAHGLPESIGAVILTGGGFILVSRVIDEIGWRQAYMYQQMFALLWVVFILTMLRQVRHSIFPARNPWFYINMIANLLAFLSLNIGMEFGYVSVVGIVGNFSIAVTMGLAYLLLRERLAANQYAGIALGLAGIVCLSL